MCLVVTQALIPGSGTSYIGISRIGLASSPVNQWYTLLCPIAFELAGTPLLSRAQELSSRARWASSAHCTLQVFVTTGTHAVQHANRQAVNRETLNGLNRTKPPDSKSV